MGCTKSKTSNPNKDKSNEAPLPSKNQQPQPSNERQKPVFQATNPVPRTRPNLSEEVPDIIPNELPDIKPRLPDTKPIIPKIGAAYDKGKRINVMVEDLRSNGRKIETTTELTIESLYGRVQQEFGYRSNEDFGLFYTGRLLPVEDGHQTLGYYGVSQDSTLDIINKPK